MSAQPAVSMGAVLVVEDEALLRIMAAELIDEAGFTAIEATNGGEALGILESRSDIIIVFSDVEMPRGMDGVELAITIRRRWPQVGIILTSGHADITDRRPPEGVAYFQKPVRHHLVIAEMQRMASMQHERE